MDFPEIDEEVLNLDAGDDVNGTRSRRAGSVQSNSDSEEDDRGVLTNFEDLDKDERVSIRASAFCQDGSALDIIDDVIDDFNLNDRMSLPKWSEAAATGVDVSAATVKVYAHTFPPALVVPQLNTHSYHRFHCILPCTCPHRPLRRLRLLKHGLRRHRLRVHPKEKSTSSEELLSRRKVCSKRPVRPPLGQGLPVSSAPLVITTESDADPSCPLMSALHRRLYKPRVTTRFDRRALVCQQARRGQRLPSSSEWKK